MGNRTDINFDKHQVYVSESAGLLIHHLRIPDSYHNSIKFINTCGIMAVTGDFGNWIFCREFHPDVNGGVSTGYWKEKLTYASTQVASKFDPEKTEAEIKRMLEEDDLSEEDREYLEDIIQCVDDELEYTYKAYREYPRNRDSEFVPFEKTTNIWLQYIFDGFDEICTRMKAGIPMMPEPVK